MRIFLLLTAMLFLGCTQEEEVPEGLLPRETFKAVLLEAQLAEARMNQELVIHQRRELPTDSYYEEVFNAHGTDLDQFQRTFDHYAARPAELRTIYEEIITELSRRKDLVPQAEPEQQQQGKGA